MTKLPFWYVDYFQEEKILVDVSYFDFITIFRITLFTEKFNCWVLVIAATCGFLLVHISVDTFYTWNHRKCDLVIRRFDILIRNIRFKSL